MNDLRDSTAELVEDRPEIESDLETLLAVDAEADTWEFQDIPLDSGDFGEVVSRGIVEKHDGEYRIADREAVKSALESDTDGTDTSDSGEDDATETGALASSPSVSLGRIVPSTDPRTVLALSGGLLLVTVFRLVPYSAVFRNGDIVLYPNDPYFYRYWIDQVTGLASGVTDFGAFTTIPYNIARSEPLLVATTSWFAELLGGGAQASGMILALYPPIAGVITGGLVYLLGRKVTDDRRVAVAAVVLLAITPMHAFRTGLGFGDHHAFDYIWLGVTAVGLVSVLAADRESEDSRNWGGALVLGLGIAGQSLAWEAGPVLSIPVGIVAVLVAVSAVRADRSPLSDGLSLLAGTGIGAAVTGVVHLTIGWQTNVVGLAPTLLFIGVLGTTLLAEAGRRQALSTRTILGAEIGLGVVGAVGVAVLVPEAIELLVNRTKFLFFTEGISETASLTSGQLGAIVGPVYNFGLVFLLAIPYLLWATRKAYRSHSPRWLALSTYAWFFLALALVQVRFAGQLGLFLTPFAGLAFVHAAAWVDVARTPGPFAGEDPTPSADGGKRRSFEWPGTRTVAYFAVFWLILATPGMAVSLGYVSNATFDDGRYGATDEMRTYATTHSLEYPDDYVLSRWDTNRLYNYFVSGESQSYQYARSQYPELLRAGDPAEWYDRYSDRIGFLAVDRGYVNGSAGYLYERLISDYGSATGDQPGLAHYRAIFDRDGILAYRLVPGATITGQAAPNATLSVSTNVSIPGAEFTYTRVVRTDASGNYSIRVAYPGEYAVGDRTVAVSEAAVEGGESVTADVRLTPKEVGAPGAVGRFGPLASPT
jgi:dolichyl-diphosphooligosaccharide--protein glycosyltransferase